MTASIPVGTVPNNVAYDAQNGYLYVPNRNSNNVSIISGNRVVATVAVGTEPIFAIYDSVNGYVYVTNQVTNNVSVISGMNLVGSVTVGYNPYYAAYDGGNGWVYVDNIGTNTVSVINGTTLVRTVTVGSGPAYATYDSKNGDMYVPNSYSANVSVINGTKVVGTIAVPLSPYGSTFDSTNGYVYVLSSGDWNITVLNGTKVVANIVTSGHPLHATYDPRNGYIYATMDGFPGAVDVINGTRDIASVTVGSTPWFPTYDPQNGYVFVPNSRDSNVSVLLDTRYVGSVAVGTSPSYVGYDPVTHDLYVPNSGSNNVSVIGAPPSPGWLAGTVAPADATVTVNGSAVPTQAGVFNESLPAGPHLVRASRFGYSAYASTVSVPSGAARTIAIVLTNRGWIVGSVLPVTAVVSVDLQPQTVINGQFNFTELGSASSRDFVDYSLSAQAVGYVSNTTIVRVTPGNVTSVAIVLHLLPPPKYPVTFSESGLPVGTSWMVRLGGTLLDSNSTNIVFTEPDGTYSFLVGRVAGWTTAGFAGSIVVNGGAVSDAVVWTQVTYSVVLTESGLPLGTRWWVNVSGGTSSSSTDASLSFAEPNGTYSCAFPAANKTYAYPDQQLSVAGLPLARTIAFSRVTYAVTFSESGLPGQPLWTVTLRGVTEVENPVLFDGISNGTYTFSVGPFPGFTATPNDGQISVKGASVNEAIAFQPIPPATFLGLTPSQGYALVGGSLGAAVVAAAVAVLWRRRGKAEPEAAGLATPLDANDASRSL